MNQQDNVVKEVDVIDKSGCNKVSKLIKSCTKRTEFCNKIVDFTEFCNKIGYFYKENCLKNINKNH